MKKRICFLAACMVFASGLTYAQKQAKKPPIRKRRTSVFRVPDSVTVARDIVYATYGDKDSAKFLLIHSEGDRVVPHKQSIILQEKLTKAGVPVTLTTIKGGGHAFWNGNSPTAKKTLADSVTFFQEALKPPAPKPETKTSEKSK